MLRNLDRETDRIVVKKENPESVFSNWANEVSDRRAVGDRRIYEEDKMSVGKVKRQTGASVWDGKDYFESPEWVYRLPQKALRQIEDNITRLRSRNGRTEDLSANDFPLDTIADDIASLKKEVATGRGFFVVRGLPAEKYSRDELGKIFWSFGAQFGVAQAQSFLGDRLGDVMDLTDEEPDRTLRRGYHSAGGQPTHTDSCNVVAMISLCKAKTGGASKLVSAHRVHNILHDSCPELLRILYEGFYLRLADSDAKAAGRSPLTDHKVPVYMESDGWLNCFFQRGYMKRGLESGTIFYTPEETAAIDVFASVSNHPDLVLRQMLEVGDMQFVNNRTVLHGREHFEDHFEKNRRRHLLRLWLHVPEWPPMSEMQDPHSDAEKLRWEENAGRRVA
jgi:hypothetical protein